VIRFLLSLLVIVFYWKCASTEEESQHKAWYPSLPGTFDSLPAMPDDNQLTQARIELGRLLFHEPLLSGDASVSCASCHKENLAFADNRRVSSGVHGRLDKRNSPSLVNVAYQKRLFMEGGVPNLEIQVLAPFGNANEMDFTLTAAAKLLQQDVVYRSLAREAYSSEINGFVISRALSAFQRSLISSGSLYDQFLLGDSIAIPAAAQRGSKLFYNDDIACGSCHSGFLYTDQEFYNVGLYIEYADEGRGRLTQNSDDLGKIKTPSLRNVAITAPYMHDGSVATLDEVLQHFNKGGLGHPNQDSRIKPLNLDEYQLSDLKAFLESLTDTIYLE